MANRGYLRSADGKWKAFWTAPPLGQADGHWQLYDMTSDRGETTGVAAQNPSIIDGLVQQWDAYMTGVGGVEPLRPRGYY